MKNAWLRPLALTALRGGAAFVLSLGLVMCKGDCNGDNTTSGSEAPTNPPIIGGGNAKPSSSFPIIGGGSARPSSSLPVIGGGKPAPGGAIVSETHGGSYTSLPVNVPSGDLTVSYTANDACKGLVASLGVEILKDPKAGSDTKNVTASGDSVGMHPLKVTAPDACNWTITVTPKK